MYLRTQGASALLWLLTSHFVYAHFVITYPGWRGNTLIANSTFPNGMQSAGPCGGLRVTQNRTAWPIDGPGAIAVQPGWYANNQNTQVFINIGFGADPDDFSLSMRSFRVLGPTNNPFPGTFCLPQLSLPRNIEPKSGDLATIQVVQLHLSGNSAQNCADIVFTDNSSQVPELNETNCFNSTGIRLEPLGRTTTTSSKASSGPTSTGSANPDAGEFWGGVPDLNTRSIIYESLTSTGPSTQDSTTTAASSSTVTSNPSSERPESSGTRVLLGLWELLGVLLLLY